MSNLIVILLFVITGSLSLLAAICNWDWFFRSTNVAFFVKYLKRVGARIFYALLGIAIWIMAIYLWLELK